MIFRIDAKLDPAQVNDTGTPARDTEGGQRLMFQLLGFLFDMMRMTNQGPHAGVALMQ